MTSVIFIAKVALTAYSAVSAVKALSEGNIMGAVMGGFGAYMGMANLGAFNTAVAGDALASTAEMGSLGVQQGIEGISETALGDTFAGMEAATGFESAALGDIGGGLLEGATAGIEGMGDLVTGAGDIGARLDIGADMGFLESAKGIGSDWMQAIKDGIAKVDFSGNLISTQDGSLLAKAGEALGGTSGLMKVGGMAMDYLGKEKAIEAQEKAAEEGYARSVAEAERKRKSVGGAPSYVYGFGNREVVA